MYLQINPYTGSLKQFSKSVSVLYDLYDSMLQRVEKEFGYTVGKDSTVEDMFINSYLSMGGVTTLMYKGYFVYGPTKMRTVLLIRDKGMYYDSMLSLFDKEGNSYDLIGKFERNVISINVIKK